MNKRERKKARKRFINQNIVACLNCRSADLKHHAAGFDELLEAAKLRRQGSILFAKFTVAAARQQRLKAGRILP